jgi:enoyl-CoA hydratase
MPIEINKTLGIIRITLARPEKRNALNEMAIAELGSVLVANRQDAGLKLLVLSGSGDKAFASGGDLKELSAVRTTSEALAMSAQFRAVLDAIREFPVPTIAALNGDALGGGAELALACDMRIAAAHSRIGFLQGKLNISTAWGGGVDLFRAVGISQGLRMLGLAEVLSAEEGLKRGLLDAVAPPDESFTTFVEHFCEGFLRRTPAVMRAFKALACAYRRGSTNEELVRIETEQFAATWVHEDHWLAVEANLGRAGWNQE